MIKKMTKMVFRFEKKEKVCHMKVSNKMLTIFQNFTTRLYYDIDILHNTFDFPLSSEET